MWDFTVLQDKVGEVLGISTVIGGVQLHSCTWLQMLLFVCRMRDELLYSFVKIRCGVKYQHLVNRLKKRFNSSSWVPFPIYLEMEMEMDERKLK